MIIRYTTPYHNFVLPFQAVEIADLDITYSQNGIEICSKSRDDVDIIDIEEIIKNASMGQDYIDEVSSKADGIESSSVLKVHLAQTETSQFIFYRAEEKNIALVQIRIRDIYNNAFVSRPIKIRVYGSLTEGVL